MIMKKGLIILISICLFTTFPCSLYSSTEKSLADVFVYPSDYISSPEISPNYSALDARIDKHNPLPSDYVPSDLTSVTIPRFREIFLRSDANEALTNLYNASKNEGAEFLALSGYRSYSTQSDIYYSHVANRGEAKANTHSAKPGYSEHQTGLAIDVSLDGTLEQSFGDTEAGIFIKENAHNYGFVISYPKGKEELTGYQYEPWHLRYVGENYATMVYNSGLTWSEFSQLCEIVPFFKYIGQQSFSESSNT